MLKLRCFMDTKREMLVLQQQKTQENDSKRDCPPSTNHFILISPAFERPFAQSELTDWSDTMTLGKFPMNVSVLIRWASRGILLKCTMKRSSSPSSSRGRPSPSYFSMSFSS